MKMKKIVATGSALALTAAVAVGGTLAWLTANTETKTNTFTYAFGGEENPINITLKDEFPDGEMYPGANLDKNVGVTVQANSMNSYVYLEVQNGFHGVEGVTLDLDTTNWVKVNESGNNTIYRYNQMVATSGEDTVLPDLLDGVSFASTMTHETLTDLDDTTIIVQAYAIQADGLTDTTNTADAEAIAWFAAN